MKIKTGHEKLKDFIGQAERDSDYYCLVHFSRCEDKFHVYHDMDMGDALLIVQELCREFEIDKRALVSSSEIPTENR